MDVDESTVEKIMLVDTCNNGSQNILGINNIWDL